MTSSPSLFLDSKKNISVNIFIPIQYLKKTQSDFLSIFLYPPTNSRVSVTLLVFLPFLQSELNRFSRLCVRYLVLRIKRFVRVSAIGKRIDLDSFANPSSIVSVVRRSNIQNQLTARSGSRSESRSHACKFSNTTNGLSSYNQLLQPVT